MTRKKLFKQAHKMTKEIVEKYKDVDYQAQFSLCLAYLLNKKEGEEIEKKRINTTRSKLEEILEMKKMFGFTSYVEVIDENGKHIDVIKATEDEEYICLDD